MLNISVVPNNDKRVKDFNSVEFIELFHKNEEEDSLLRIPAYYFPILYKYLTTLEDLYSIWYHNGNNIELRFSITKYKGNMCLDTIGDISIDVSKDKFKGIRHICFRKSLQVSHVSLVNNNMTIYLSRIVSDNDPTPAKISHISDIIPEIKSYNSTRLRFPEIWGQQKVYVNTDELIHYLNRLINRVENINNSVMLKANSNPTGANNEVFLKDILKSPSAFSKFVGDNTDLLNDIIAQGFRILGELNLELAFLKARKDIELPVNQDLMLEIVKKISCIDGNISILWGNVEKLKLKFSEKAETTVIN